MANQFSISLFLDTRRIKENGLYPVKLRVYSASSKKAKLYTTEFEFTEKDYQSIWQTEKPRQVNKEIRNKLNSLQSEAEETAKNINPFSFDRFENKLFQHENKDKDVFYYYASICDKYRKLNHYSTASIFEGSSKSLKRYIKHKTGKEATALKFIEITSFWLEEYEIYMLKIEGKSRTTVTMYLRELQKVFNTAISEGEISQSLYPFGKDKYKIPTSHKVIKALSTEQSKQLFQAKPLTKEQEFAKDFWFFSYACNGMNFKDIAMLKYKDLEDEKFSFYRAKTINTKKSNQQKIQIYLNDYSRSIINKYGNKDKSANNYIFPFISDQQAELQKHHKIIYYIYQINRSIKQLAVQEDLTNEISLYWARHSFATNSINKGASMEFISEALGHSDMKMTQNYFAGFDEKIKKQYAQSIMNF